MRKRGHQIGDRWLTAVDCESLTRADRVVVNSHLVRSEVMELYGLPEKRLHLVRNVVDSERFCPRKKSDVSTVVFPGGGVARKGLRVAVEAMRRVPDADLVVMGEVPRMLQAWAKSTYPRVRFLGRVDDPERVIGSAHALVLPTMYDPSSNAVLEAMSAGYHCNIHDGAAELLPHRWMAISDPLDAARCASVGGGNE